MTDTTILDQGAGTAQSDAPQTEAAAAAETFMPVRPQLADGLVYDEALETAALAASQKLGLSAGQVQGLVDFYAGHQSEAHRAALDARAADEARAIGALQGEWGASFPAKIAQAARAARHFGGEELIGFLNDSGMGNNTHLVRAFARIGALMAEDTLKAGAGAASGFAPAGEAARREAQRLMARPAYTNGDDPEHASAVAMVQQMFERAFEAADARA